jgi:hypothetical protein
VNLRRPDPAANALSAWPERMNVGIARGVPTDANWDAGKVRRLGRSNNKLSD